MKKMLIAVISTAAVLVYGPSLPGLLGDKLGDFVSSLNPFEEKTVDRTGPSVLRALTDLSEYAAARAHYETVVDLEKDTDNLPDWISGERVLYVAKGDVNAVVNFDGLDEDRVNVSEETKAVDITLPAVTLGEPVLDLENSYVAEYDKGLANAFEGSELPLEAQTTAVEKMTAAASEEAELVDMAEDNTTAMLQGLLGALGYTDVTVTFED